MKLIKNGKMFVQKGDIQFLTQTGYPIPAFMLLKLCKNGITIINSMNKYDFVEFANEDEIEFFKKVEVIPDYNEFVCSSDEEIIEYGQKLLDTMNGQVLAYRAMSQEEKNQNKDIMQNATFMDYQIRSVADILKYRQGILKFKMPGEEPKNPLKKLIQKITKKEVI